MSLEEKEIFNTKAFSELIRDVVRQEMQAIIHEDRLLTAEQVAKTLAFKNTARVRELVRDGYLTRVNLGEQSPRYKSSEVQKLVEQGIS